MLIQEETTTQELRVPTSSLEISDLDVYYSKFKALENINLIVPERSVTAFIGPSGCGKSTLLRTINRMHELTRGGRISGKIGLANSSALTQKSHFLDIYGRDADPVNIRRRVGMVFQRPNPFVTMTIRENILAGAMLTRKKMTKSDADDLVEESLRSANLWGEVRNRLNLGASELSGGQQQRLCIARAIAVKPEVLLMDEPCSALDPISTIAIEELITEISKEITIVIVTHNMQQAARISQRTAFFNVSGLGEPGRLVESGATAQIFSNPRVKATEDYVSGRFG